MKKKSTHYLTIELSNNPKEITILQTNMNTMMYDLIEEFPNNLIEAKDQYDNHALKLKRDNIENIVICGLGGSGFIGDLILDICSKDLKIPVVVVKSYRLPKFVNEKTLLIIASYSGNTEEALSCYDQSIAKGLKPICTSAGGQLKQKSIENNIEFIQLPTGFPPRTSLGFGFSNVLSILVHFGILPNEYLELPSQLGKFLLQNQEAMKKDAQEIAKTFKSNILIAYAEDAIEAIALRLKQQINENSKAYCWYNILPELNHNELVGWKQSHHAIKALFLRTSFEHERNKHRFEFMKPVLETYDTEVISVQAIGETFPEQYFYLIHWCDWLSYYLALEHEEDPVEVEVIDKLKAYLSTIN